MNRISQPITITLTPQLLKVANKIAKEEGRGRSELFRDAIRAFLWKRRREAIQVYGAKKAKEMGIKTEEDIDDIVHEVRRSHRA